MKPITSWLFNPLNVLYLFKDISMYDGFDYGRLLICDILRLMSDTKF